MARHPTLLRPLQTHPLPHRRPMAPPTRRPPHHRQRPPPAAPHKRIPHQHPLPPPRPLRSRLPLRPIVTTPTGEIPNHLGPHAGVTCPECDALAFSLALDYPMATASLPDVRYDLPNWTDRARTLLDALGGLPAR